MSDIKTKYVNLHRKLFLIKDGNSVHHLPEFFTFLRELQINEPGKDLSGPAFIGLGT